VVLVACAVICFLVLVGEQTVVDLRWIVSLPAWAGFAALSGNPINAHPGFAAPRFADRTGTSRCDPTQPTFILGMAALKTRLGLVMGTPRECEHTINADGDSVQFTSTGVASYIQSAQTLTFTDGLHRWTLIGGLLTLRIPAYPADDYTDR
jgi:hypothetical protein